MSTASPRTSRRPHTGTRRLGHLAMDLESAMAVLAVPMPCGTTCACDVLHGCAARAADRRRHPGRQGSDLATTTRSPRTSTTARSGPSSGSGSSSPGSATAASAAPATRCSRHLPDRPGWTCSTWRSATASISTGCRRTGGSSGVDISRSQLEACRRRAAGRPVWLAQCEAEELPLESQPVRRRPEHRRLQLLQRSRRRPARDGPRGPPRRSDRRLRRTAQLDRPHARPQTGIPGARSLDRLAADAPGRLVHRHGRTSSRSRRAGDRRASASRNSSSSPVWRGVGYVLVGRRTRAEPASGVHRRREGLIRAVHHPDRQERPAPAGPHGA